MQEFFHMGGYAFYVWTSYALALAILALNVLIPLLRRQRLLRSIAQRRKRERRAP